MEAMNLEVALLFSDYQTASRISKVFKELGIIPYLYTSLSVFWRESLQSAPHFIVTDVRMLSEGERQLVKHPLVVKKNIPLAIYFDQESAPLLRTALNVKPRIIINGALDLRTQIESAVKAELVYLGNKMAMDKIASELDAGRLENLNLKQRLQDKTAEEHALFIQELISMSRSALVVDFLKLVEHSLDKLDVVGRFAILEMSSKGDRLFSPPLRSRKYQSLPGITLRRAHDFSLIDQQAAIKVATDQLGLGVVMLPIRGIGDRVSRLVFVKSGDSRFFNSYPWDSIAEVFTLLQFKNLLNSSSVRENPEINIWDLLSIVDQNALAANITINEQEKLNLYDLDLSNLVMLVKSQANNVFDWGRFGKDVLIYLQKIPAKRIDVVASAPDHIALLTEEASDSAMETIKHRLAQFPFWQYFESPEKILHRNVDVSVKELPLSSLQYVEHLASLKGEVQITKVIRSQIQQRKREITV